MPSDDLVLSVRQISGYSPTGNAPPSAALLIQLGGLGGPYASISPQALVSTALAQGGDMAISGALSALSISGGRAQFSNGSFGVLGAQSACIGNLTANYGSINGVPIATANDLAALAAQSVRSFNMRFGDIMLTVDDIICAGGAPIFSPVFQGVPRGPTAEPWANTSQLATCAFVQMAIAQFMGDLSAYAPLDSPAFSGVPTAPTAAPGSSDGQLATTAFVMNAVAASVAGVVSVNGRTGVVVLTGADLTAAGGALLASPAFTGAPQAPTAVPGTSTTQLATCAFVAAAVAAVPASVTSFNTRTGAITLTTADVAAVGVSAFNGRIGSVNLIANDISAVGGAMLNSPNFIGSPTAPTAAPGTTTTQLATCAFVTAAIAVVGGVSSFNGRTGVVSLTAADVTVVGGALLASPTFTGTPQAPTATAGTNTTQLATTAFVIAAVAAATAGVSSFNSRTGVVTLIANDISGAGGALLASPALTGGPTAPTAAPGTTTTQLATCAFVTAAIAAVTRVTTFNGRSGAVTLTTADVSAAGGPYLPLSGGTLTGSLFTSGGFQANSGAVVSQASGAGNASFICSNNAGTQVGSFFWDPSTGSLFMQTLGATPSAAWIDGPGSFNTSYNVKSTLGYLSKAGSSGAFGGNNWNFDWTGAALACWIDGSNQGNVSLASDYRIKRNVADLGSMWDRAKALRPIRYNLRDYTPPGAKAALFIGDDVERWGFIAHELQETLIADAATGEKDSPTHVQSPNPWTVIATLTRALQEAMTRIETLEARMT